MIASSQDRTGSDVPVIMIVDDEEIVTKTLSAYLSIETDYEILAYQSPKEALERLRQNAVDLVITDFLMPEMDGLQFLSQAQALYPDLASILLTGYADKESAIKAINKVSLYQYVEKPWDNEHLKLIIRNAIDSKTLKENLRLKINELDAVLLERDRLFEDNEMLREELLLAQNVQQGLLPTCFPNSSQISISAKYEPALAIGGDFYDVVPLAGGKFALLIADVTGHGIQAALITVLLKSAFLELKGCDLGPGEILADINKLLFKILPRHIYVAGLVLVVDPQTARCCLVNGGVPHPFLVKGRSGTVARIPANGLLLGIASTEVYKPGEEVSIQLQQGDTLILYTDGLSEVSNEADQHFDDQMVATLAQVACRPNEAILNHLVRAAKKFSKPGHAWDDVTILGIRCSK
ncbi:MAG: PP2C family protein-serine/threonine phosphatase [bacterium]